MSTLFTDDFNRANGGLGANWTDLAAGLAISSNQVAGIATEAAAYYNGGTPAANAWVQLKYSTKSATAGYLGLRLNTATFNGYTFNASTGLNSGQVLRLDGGVPSGVGRVLKEPADGSVVRVEMRGSTISIYYDDVLQGTRTDANHSAANRSFIGGTGTALRLDDFATGNLPTLSSPTPSGTLGTSTTATIGATTDESAGTIYAVADKPRRMTGAALLFASNSETGCEAILLWQGANLLPRTSHTAIWKANYKHQAGYYAVAWHTSYDGTFHGSRYEYGTHPYPTSGGANSAGVNTGTGNDTHYYEIALNALDYIASPGPGATKLVVKETWVTQARTCEIVNISGTDYVRHRYYPDVDNDPTFFIQQDVTKASYDADAASVVTPTFLIGTSPWALGVETPSGELTGIRLFNAALSISDIALEAEATTDAAVTSAGASSLWYSNIAPTVSDVSDKSGAGHSPTWANADRPTNSTVAPSAKQIKDGKNAFGVTASGAGSSAVSGSSPSVGLTGLTPSTAYAYAAVQFSGANSNIVTGTFTTSAPIAPGASSGPGLVIGEGYIGEGAIGAPNAAPSGSSYSVSVSESATATDAISASLQLPAALAEAAAAGDSKAASLVALAAVAEAGSAADTLSAIGAWLRAISEAASASDSKSATGAWPTNLTETAAADDLVTSSPSYTGALSEAANAVDQVAAILAAAAALAEAASATDSKSALGSFGRAVSEAATATDSKAATLAALGAISETATAGEVMAASFAALAAVLEAATAGDSKSAGGASSASLSETAAASDVIAAGPVYVGSIAESAAATEAMSSLVAALMTIAETGSASDSMTGVAQKLAGLIDSASASDTATALLNAGAQVSEAVAALDALQASAAIGVVVIEAANATDLVALIDSAARAAPGRTLIVSPATRELRIVGAGDLRRLIVIRPQRTLH